MFPRTSPPNFLTDWSLYMTILWEKKLGKWCVRELEFIWLQRLGEGCQNFLKNMFAPPSQFFKKILIKPFEVFNTENFTAVHCWRKWSKLAILDHCALEKGGLDAWAPDESVINAATPTRHAPLWTLLFIGKAFKSWILILLFFFEKLSHDGIVLGNVVIPAS